MTGSLFTITAASGTGKTSLVKQLLATTSGLAVSISHTTRVPRVGEIDGKDYHFIDTQTFDTMVSDGQFLETAEVFGNYYGTSQQAVEMMLKNGVDVILEIDWQGALQVKRLIPETTAIFILPPDKKALRQRLAGRGQDTMAVIETRLAGATHEISQYVQFDYLVINDNFDVALAELKAIIIAHRLTLEKQQARHYDKISQLLSP